MGLKDLVFSPFCPLGEGLLKRMAARTVMTGSAPPLSPLRQDRFGLCDLLMREWWRKLGAMGCLACVASLAERGRSAIPVLSTDRTRGPFSMCTRTTLARSVPLASSLPSSCSASTSCATSISCSAS